MTLLDKPWEDGFAAGILHPAPALENGRASQERGHAVQCSGWACLLTLSSANRRVHGDKTNHLFSPSRVNWTSFSGVQMSVIKHVLHQMPSASIR